MSVSYIEVDDFGSVARKVAARDLDDLGIFYPMDEPEVVIVRVIPSDGAGDPTIISPVPCVVRSLRLWNGGDIACHAKLHNVAGIPVVGVAAVEYSASAQAGQNNPDPRLSAGGMFFDVGCGLTLTTGLPDDDVEGVVADTAIVIVELHLP